MTNIEEYFIYKQRFNNSFQDRFDKIINSLKHHLGIALYKNKWTSKYLEPYEVHILNQISFRGEYASRIFGKSNVDQHIYKNIQLKTIVFYEAIEIDNFDTYRKKILSRFTNNQIFYSDKENLEQKLLEVKNNLDAISRGNLFALKYKKKVKRTNDLMSSINVSYIKTNESYFILKIQVTPSEKFNSIFKQIIISKDVSLSFPHYNTFFNILKTRRFISYESINNSLKCKNIANLVSDINQQVKLNVTKYLKGYFHNSKTSSILPSVEFYEVDSIIDFHKDDNLKNNFNTGFNGYFALPDNEIEIYFSDSSGRKQNLIQVVKQREHGSQERQENNYTDYDKIETYSLLESLGFPCVFRGILKKQSENLNKLKRDIYDFVNNTKRLDSSHKRNFWLNNNLFITNIGFSK